MPFIINQNSLILAVSKAFDDLAIFDGLKLARTVDPYVQRTIGFITQIDLMDEGSNQTYPLQLGYVGVIMRGQTDIKKTKQLQINQRMKKHFLRIIDCIKICKQNGYKLFSGNIKYEFYITHQESITSNQGNYNKFSIYKRI